MQINANKVLSSNVAIAIFIIAVTFAAFYNALQGEFVNWDDPGNTVENHYYRGLGWEQIKWSFASFYREHYMPLSWIIFSVNYVLWGLNSFGYHLTSLIFHIATAIAFYFLALKLLKSKTGAIFAALFFALHPLRVEAVSWVSAGAYPIAGLFYVLCIIAYKNYTQSRNKKIYWYLAALGFFILALLSKSIAVSLPIVLLILDYYPLRRKAYPEKIPFFILALLASVATLLFVESISVYKTDLWQRPFLILYSLSFYIEKTILPANLSPIYELYTFRGRLLDWDLILRYIFVLALFICSFLGRKKYPAFAAAFWAYAVILFPVSGILPTGPQVVADRYSYLACLGFAILAGWAIAYFWNKWLTPSAILIVILFSALTWNQIKIWKDSESLWSQAISIFPDSAIAHTNLGNAIYRKGDISGAISHYKLALALNPKEKTAHFDLGNALTKQNDFNGAIEQYKAALAIDPAYERALINLGVILYKKGDKEDAIRHYEEALKLKPDSKEIRENLEKIKQN